MFLTQLMFALLVALALTLLLAPLMGAGRLRDRGAAVGVGLFMFAIIFLAAWAGGLWLAPFGPAVWDVYWLPFLVTGLLVALLIAALVPKPSQRSTITGTAEQDRAEAAAILAFGAFFWILVLMLVAAIFAGYWWT